MYYSYHYTLLSLALPPLHTKFNTYLTPQLLPAGRARAGKF
eukprot:SAG31_NODE_11799_length_997_cov_1.243875_2_plen_40_part_01